MRRSLARALRLHVPAALTRAPRARHADADLVNLSLRPTYDQPRLLHLPRAPHTVAFCQCRCHASHYTELAHRHSRRAIADGSREPEYAPPTTSPLHLPRVPHTVAFANASGAMQVTTPSWRIVTRAAPLLTDLGNLSTPHLRPAPCTCRAFLTLLRLPRQVSSSKSLHQADA